MKQERKRRKQLTGRGQWNNYTGRYSGQLRVKIRTWHSIKHKKEWHNKRDPSITPSLDPLMGGTQAVATVCPSIRYPKFNTEWNILTYRSHTGRGWCSQYWTAGSNSDSSLPLQPLALKKMESIEGQRNQPGCYSPSWHIQGRARSDVIRLSHLKVTQNSLTLCLS